MKSTKKQIQAAYDAFFGTLRNLNGGTREENERSAQACLNRLEEHASVMAELMKNPSAHVLRDSWLMGAGTVAVPERLASFKTRYAHVLTPTNIIQFRAA